MLPLALVLPVFVYAFAAQTIMVSKTQDHERYLAKCDVETIRNRLNQIQGRDTVTCRDYAHWNDTYRQVLHPTRAWLDVNVGNGIVNSYGFDVCVLMNQTGRVVWSSGAGRAIFRDIQAARILRRCLGRGRVSGFMRLGGEAYACSAMSILRSDHTGRPRGMLLAARRIKQPLLSSLAPGAQHRLVFYQNDGNMSRPLSPADYAELPQATARAVDGNFIPDDELVEVSNSGEFLLSVIPVADVRGRIIGGILDMYSRSNLVHSIQAIRLMSAALMMLCVIVGLAGASYYRNKGLAQRAERDHLTGLHNHGYLQEQLKNQVGYARRYGRSLAVLMIDIDHFKVLNDTHGHTAGDVVLRHVAEVTSNAMRASDTVARYGGEEFVVLMPEADPSQARAAGERLRLLIEGDMVLLKPCKSRGGSCEELRVTVSIGVASFHAEEMGSDELLAAADTALAAAKTTRNAVVVFDNVIADQAAGTTGTVPLDGFLRDASISTIRPLVAAIDLRDPRTARHSEKTAEYAVAIGKELGFSTQQLALTCKASLLHDVGMIGIPDQILTKAERLTADELEIVKTHSRLGTETLLRSPQLAPVAEIVKSHHERWDGSGYPDGLSGQDIPLIARVVSVADVLDAMMSHRSYREPLSPAEAIAELRAQSGKQFDPEVVEAAVKVFTVRSEAPPIRRAA